MAIVAEDELRDAVTEGTDAILVLDQTPFYAEMGGQTADHGVICTLEAEFTVLDVQKNKGGKFMHYGKVTRGSFAVGDTVEARVDETRRRAIMRAHSATHLLDQALRTVLGDHAHQAGSLVEEDRLRYDFTHFSAVTAEELREVSRLVSEQILAGLDVDVREMPIEEAKKAGAIALFGEKYGDVVRVVNMGGWSVELCGGTHVDNTAKIGPFRITSETSVASGVRRIEAVTGQAFLDQVDEMNARLVRAGGGPQDDAGRAAGQGREQHARDQGAASGRRKAEGSDVLQRCGQHALLGQERERPEGRDRRAARTWKRTTCASWATSCATATPTPSRC